MYIVDANSDEKYFIVKVISNELILFKISKKCNSLEKVINMLGKENIKEIK